MPSKTQLKTIGFAVAATFALIYVVHNFKPLSADKHLGLSS